MPRNPESGPSEEILEGENQESENPILERRDQMMERATDMQKRVAEIQGAEYQTALLRVMEKSGDDTRLVNAMGDFLESLDWRSDKGGPDGENFNKDGFAEFLEKMTKEVRGS